MCFGRGGCGKRVAHERMRHMYCSKWRNGSSQTPLSFAPRHKNARTPIARTKNEGPLACQSRDREALRVLLRVTETSVKMQIYGLPRCRRGG